MAPATPPYTAATLYACVGAVHFIGRPEGDLALIQAAAYLALAPKSDALYRAHKLAIADVREHGALGVPLALRNAPTRLMKDLGYGAEYRHAHDSPRPIDV